jgi:periplasmic nitrate reductase NapD
MDETINISSLLVLVPPGQLQATMQRLAGLAGVEVHYSDPATGRIVATMEASTVDDQQDGLRHIQALPHVIQAEMAFHYCGPDFPEA